MQLHRITKCTSVVGDNDLLSVAVLECRETDQNGWENSRSAQAVV